MKQWILRMLLILFLSIGLTAQTGVAENYTQAMEIYRRAWQNLADDHFIVAQARFQEVERYLQEHPEERRYFDHYNRGLNIQSFIEDYQRLSLAQPMERHRVLILYVAQTRVNQNGHVIEEQMTPQIVEEASVSQEIARKYALLLSRGVLNLEFTTISLNAALTEIGRLDQSGNFILDPQIMLESLRPYPQELLMEEIQNFDSLWIYWNDGGLVTHQGQGGRAYGGTMDQPIIPGRVYGPERGRLVISASLADRPGTLFHEFFHSLEYIYGIRPIHGFRSEYRGSFPEWTGEGEMDYYSFHYELLLQQDSFSATALHQYRPNLLDPQAVDEFMEFQPELTLGEIQTRGIELARQRNWDQALLWLNQCLAGNPHDAETRYWLGVCHYNRGNLEESYHWMQSALEQQPESRKIQVYLDFLEGRMGQ